MDEAVSGIVADLICMPGRSDIQIRLEAGSDGGTMRLHANGHVTLDGLPVTLAELFAQVLTVPRRLKVTLHPRADHYGSCLDAEFVTQS